MHYRRRHAPRAWFWMATKTATNINFYYANIALITLFLRMPRQTNFPHHTPPRRNDTLCVSSSSALQLSGYVQNPLIALINHWKIGFSYVLLWPLLFGPGSEVYTISDTHRCLVAVKSIESPFNAYPEPATNRLTSTNTNLIRSHELVNNF